MNLNRTGFRERSYFKYLKTQSKISACHLFCCSHVRTTFVLNPLPVCPLLSPKPLKIYFSCYHDIEVKKYNIQFNVTINSTLYTIFRIWTVRSFLWHSLMDFWLLDEYIFGDWKVMFLWAYANDYFWNAINIFLCVWVYDYNQRITTFFVCCLREEGGGKNIYY